MTPKGAILVTGASQGIGQAIAQALCRRGAAVFGCARTVPGLEATAAACHELPGRFGFAVCDVRETAQVAATVREAAAWGGGLWAVVNNAGNVARAPLAALDPAVWDDVVRTNLTAAFLVCKYALPHLETAGGGRIVNIASIAGRQGTALLAAYNAAKHGLVGLTRSLAAEYAGRGVVANAVCPGSVDTPMLAQGVPGAVAKMTPADIAATVVFLLLDAPASINGACIDQFG